MDFIGNESLHLPKQLSHAYLIAGGLGSGRGLLIKHLSMLAQCLSEGDKPCGSCGECVKIQKNIHPDLGHFGLEKPMNVDAVRALRQDVFTRPHQGKRKIYVIHQADQLNHNGQNALLKILEEPPNYALFFLVTEEGGGVLETIRSRCQQLTLRPVTTAQALAYLEKRFPQQENLAEIAQKSEGFLGRAVAICKPPEPEETPDTGLKPVKKKAKEPKAKEPKEEKNIPLEHMADTLRSALFAKNELLLLEACQPFRKLDKTQSLALIDLLRSKLAQDLARTREKRIFTWIQFLEDISAGLHANVKGEQIACWLSAGLWKKGDSSC